MRVAALVAAAGLGLRLGPGAPKALRLLAGESLLVHSVRAVCVDPRVVEVVVAVPQEAVADVAADLQGVVHVPVTVVAGGVLRQDSVEILLSAVGDDVSHVLVHDAARPLVPAGTVARVLDELAAGSDAVIPVRPVTDTIKSVAQDPRPNASTEMVAGTVDRAALRAVQTPQGYRCSLLRRAHAHRPENLEATDESSLVELLGEPVAMVPGDPEAFQVTTPFDFTVAESVLAARSGGAADD